MIILDTNVISEMIRPSPEQKVIDWIALQPSSQLFTTAIAEAEIRYGVARLPSGKRKDMLFNAIDGIFGTDLFGRVLSFDSEAAIAYARIVSDRDRIGRPISQFDAQIAAIVLSCDARLATRNVRDFEGCGLNLTNPWGDA
jgi:hypothetical protein